MLAIYKAFDLFSFLPCLPPYLNVSVGPLLELGRVRSVCTKESDVLCSTLYLFCMHVEFLLTYFTTFV